MDLINLKIIDFLGHNKSEIDFSSISSALIVGKSKNDDRVSNGVGKTTIFRALDYVLFNEYHTKTIDKIVRDGCDKCEVTLDFSVSNITYRAVRTRRKVSSKSDIRLYKCVADNWLDISAKTPSETDAELAKIIKFTYKTFVNSVLFVQSDLSGLSSAKPEAKKAILKDVLNIAEYSKLEKLSKKEVSSLNSEKEANEKVILFIGEPQADIDKNNNNLQELNSELVNFEKLYNSFNSELLMSKSKLSNLEGEFNSELLTLRNKINFFSDAKSKLETEIGKIITNIELKSNELIKLNTEPVLLEAKLNEFKINFEKFADIKDDSILKDSLFNLKDNSAYLKGNLQILTQKIKDLQTPMPDGEECNSCFQKLTDEHKESHQLKTDVEISNLSINIEKSKLELLNLTEEIKKAEIEISDIFKYNKVKNELEQNIKILSAKLNGDKKYLNGLTASIKEQQEVLDSKNIELEFLLAEEKATKQRYNDLLSSSNINEIKKEKAKILTYEENINRLSDKLTLLQTNIGILNEKISARTIDLNKLILLVSKQETIKKQISMYEIVSYSFGSSGIPSLIIYTILDDLQLETNKLLAQLRPGLALRFVVEDNSDDLDIIYTINSKDRDYEQLSGGQKLYVALALKLGLSLVIQKRLGVKINFLALDEIDQPLDKAGVEALATVIKKWQENFKILVITHNDALKDKFSNAILVEYDEENGSSAKVVDSW